MDATANWKVADEDIQNIETANCSRKHIDHNPTKEDTMKKTNERIEENEDKYQNRVQLEEEFSAFRAEDEMKQEAENEYEEDFFLNIFSVLILI